METVFPKIGEVPARPKVEDEFINPDLEAAYKAAQTGDREKFFWLVCRVAKDHDKPYRRAYNLRLAAYIAATSVGLSAALIIFSGAL